MSGGAYRITTRPGRIDDDAWDATAAGCPEATIFHTRVWARVVCATFPALHDASVWCRDGMGDILVPRFAWRRALGLFVTRHSSFPFVYGGPIPALPASSARYRALRAALDTPLVATRWTGNPFAGVEDRDPGAGETCTTDSTHVLDLPATEEEYWETSLSTGKRNDVRRLSKKGLELSLSRSAEDVRAVHQLYLESFARWGGRPGFVYPEAYYQNLLGMPDGLARLHVARHEGRIVGGAFTVQWNGIAHYVAGYFDPGARTLRPNVLLQIETIRAAIRDGCRRYDFLPSGGHGSVAAFKEGLGGRPVPFLVYERNPLLHRLARARRRGTAPEQNG